MTRTKYKNRKYTIVSYNSGWKRQFGIEAQLLQSILKNKALSVEHIGSTAVLGLAGKPTIDILVTVKNISTADEFSHKIELLGYKALGEYVTRDARLFVKEVDNTRLVNLHVFEVNHPHVKEMLNLKNYFSVHPEIVKEYSKLKLRLVKKYPNNYGQYRKFKDKWVNNLKRKIEKSLSLNFDKGKFIEIVKRYSYFRNSINWDNFSHKVLATEKIDLKTVNNFLRKIDKHSFAVENKKTKERKSTTRTPKIITKEISKDIGLLELPGFFTLESNQYIKNFDDIVHALKKLKGKKKLILDLSKNTGGNMYPWLAALASLYDTECVGYFDYKYKKTKDKWLIKKDGVYCGKKKWFKKINKDNVSFEKIAILVSSQTSSSGEAIAISFRGQNNVKIFGQKTANFTTGNEEFKNGELTIWLSTCLMQDRKQRDYGNGINPDVSTKAPIKDIGEWLNF